MQSSSLLLLVSVCLDNLLILKLNKTQKSISKRLFSFRDLSKSQRKICIQPNASKTFDQYRSYRNVRLVSNIGETGSGKWKSVLRV